MILLDEVDSSLHPYMIAQFLHVIDKIFVGEKKLKVIMVTHSPSTIALFPHETVYVLKNELKCYVTPTPKKDAIEFLTEGFITYENGIKLLDQISKKKINIISEGKNVHYLKKANEYFGNENIDIMYEMKDCTGKTQLNTLFNFLSQAPHENKVIIIWDCEVRNSYKAKNNTFPHILKKNPNSKSKTGIENLFNKNSFNKGDFYVTIEKEDGGTHTSLNKNKFQKYMISNGTKEDFINFKYLFDWIKTEIDK
jgi:energy-coupling factor transporter ATP-binding protein EcfA2